jgi:PAS domain S-box-containing protein
MRVMREKAGGPRAPDALDGRLVEILQSVADGVTVLDRNGTVRFANGVAARLLGFGSADEIVGRSGAELTGRFELLDAEGAPFPTDQMPTRLVLAGEPEVEATMRFRSKNSAHDRWSLVRARLLPGATAEHDLVVTAFQDITSVKRSEARLRFLSDASAMLGESTDYRETLARVAEISVPVLADWCVVDVLERAQGINRVAVAHADADRLTLAQEVTRRWPPDPNRAGAVQTVLREGRSVHLPDMSREQLAAAAQDEEHLAALQELGLRSVLIVPLLARGEILGAMSLIQAESGRRMEADDIALAEDLGRRAGAAIDAVRLVWEAHEIARMRDDFVAVASHDMRTPLAAVRGYAQLARRHIERGRLDARKLDGWLADIDEVVGRLNELVSELMDASLIQGGREVPLDATETDLAGLCGDLVERRRQLHETHRFHLHTNGVRPTGLWDAARLRRVLDNLVDNAVKFSPDGGEITLKIGASDGSASVAVTDHGIGVAPGELELIFSPMYRGRNARGTVGTGLGLSGSRRLIRQMGGSVSVKSRLGEGSTFTVLLPLSSS